MTIEEQIAALEKERDLAEQMNNDVLYVAICKKIDELEAQR